MIADPASPVMPAKTQSPKGESCLTSSATSLSKILGVSLLVVGTCIGAGMLALPVSTAAGGFYYSSGAFVFCWFMMTVSALMMLEASLYFPNETNIITMVKTTWGRGGEIFAWVTYVLFLYALMTAYTSGAAGIIAKGLTFIGIPESFGIWILTAVFASIVYMGTKAVDLVNRWMVLGLVVAYFALVFNVIPKVSGELVTMGEPKYLWTVGPLLVTSFGFHLTIPSLKNYLNGDVNALRIGIIGGSTMALVVYLIWELLILGVVPVSGEKGLIAILHAEQTTGKQAVIELTQILSDILHNPQITFFARSFGLFAILTSFIGVSLGLYDFFADGFSLNKTGKSKVVLALLTFLPPILIAMYYPRFIQALHYAGIFAAVLLVILPALLVWFGRYRMKLQTPYHVWGGKPLVALVLLFGFGVIALEVLHHLHALPVPLLEQHLFE